jgi:hypothetical protein
MKTKSVLAKPVSNQSFNPSHHQPVASLRLAICHRALWLACALALTLAGCDNKPTTNNNVETKPATPTSAPAPAGDAAQIMARNRKLDDSRDSSSKMRARIHVDSNAALEVPIPSEVQLTILRKRQADGGQALLVEFTAPPQERDRSSLIVISPQGEIEATRYSQSNNSFVSAKGALSEDSLFGLTLQELADGQPEKYDFTIVGEETINAKPAYKLEGKLKPNTESKFARLVIWIAKDNATLLAAEFYDNHNELQRRLTVEKWEQISGHWTRTRWTIDNRARQRKVDFEVLDTKYDQNLSDALFTREQLKKLTAK